MNDDPYRVLGISRSVTEEEAKQAYRKLAKQYHPDRNGGSAEAEAKMKEINDAYAKVMDDLRGGGSSSRGYTSGYGSYGGGYDSSSSWGSTYGAYGSYSGSGAYGNYGGSAQFSSVRSFLAARRFAEAMSALNAIHVRTAEWNYLAAQAMFGMGNRVAALEYAQQAVNMDPTNAAYVDLLNRLEYASGAYAQQSTGFGGMPCTGCMPCTGGSCLEVYLCLQTCLCCCRPCC